MTFTGTLVVLNRKEVQGRNGPISAWSGKVEKPDGEEYDAWVGFGFKKPPCSKGDSVVILAKKEGGFWKAVDVEVTAKADEAGEVDPEEVESGDSGTKAKSASSARPVSSSSKEAPSGLKDKRIGYQNSRTAALELASILLLNKAVPLSGTAGKTGEANRFKEVTALVDKLTVKFCHDLETFRLLSDVEDAYEAPAKAEPGFDPENDDEDEPNDE
jgi:hypothetical protein